MTSVLSDAVELIGWTPARLLEAKEQADRKARAKAAAAERDNGNSD